MRGSVLATLGAPLEGGDATALISEPPQAPTPNCLFDYGLVSNLHTAALISRFGSIDWACMPYFSYPSVFARLLDVERGGSHLICPREASSSHQRYLPGTNVLETLFLLEGGRALKVIDFMPFVESVDRKPHPHLFRIVSAEGGPVPIHVRFHPRFEYGRHPASYLKVPDGHIARHEPTSLFYRVSQGTTEERGPALETDVLVEPHTSAEVEISWMEEGPCRESARKLFDRTVRFWRAWSEGTQVPAEFVPPDTRLAVERSNLLLKALTSRESGAFVAAATTSLPEWPGGGRNWDYRYSWIRDAAFSANALILSGHLHEAKAFLRWAVRCSQESHDGSLQVVYRLQGTGALTEEEIPELSGFLGSRPVRIGNGAGAQFQLDIYGTILNLAFTMKDVDERYIAEEWTHFRTLVEHVLRIWREPDQGIWEIRGPPRHYVHSKLMAWVALDRGAQLARRFGTSGEAVRWGAEAARVRHAILEQGYDSALGAFVQAFDRRVLDAATLKIPLYGLLPFSDERVTGTIRAIERGLCDGAFVYRYRADDGIDGPEGAFLLCSFWLVECLARSGEIARARRNWDELLTAGSPLGLFSEEYDPRTRTPLGNYPQAFTHIGVIRAAHALGLAEKEARRLAMDRAHSHPE